MCLCIKTKFEFLTLQSLFESGLNHRKCNSNLERSCFKGCLINLHIHPKHFSLSFPSEGL